MKKYQLIKFVNNYFILQFLLFLLVILICDHGNAQRRNGYLGLDAGIYATDRNDPGIGIHFSGNAEVANALFLGAEVGAIKFDNLDKAYIPLLVRFSAMPQINSSKANLLVVVAPGYGIYDDSHWRNNFYYKSKGGFTFYGGLGAAFKTKSRAYLSFTVGYSTFGFTSEGYKSNIDGIGIRIGAMFR